MTEERKQPRRWTRSFFRLEHVVRVVHRPERHADTTACRRPLRRSWYVLPPVARWILATSRWPLHMHAPVWPYTPDPDRPCPTSDRTIYVIREASAASLEATDER
ncbi:hypothetical protein ACHHYP_04274 [Achlya hypogyna]|uniref:Uncharacterized protein n=1 Tax=Achlya hypogyna TaxID=1202772 RepID=A0A1V9Z1V9_ACHHY|nr:hypothetical protein ACHHYP_04274 [Achlya hypogyna]